MTGGYTNDLSLFGSVFVNLDAKEAAKISCKTALFVNIFWFFEITPLYGLKVSFLSHVFIALCLPHNHLIHLIEIQFSDSAWNILTRSNEIRCDENYTKTKNRSLSFRIDERATLWYVEMRTAERERETRIKYE